MRDIEFKIWDKKKISPLWHFYPIEHKVIKLIEYSGFKDINGKKIFDGDYWREEVEENYGDDRFYHIMSYVKEWGIWCWLIDYERMQYEDATEYFLRQKPHSTRWEYLIEDTSNVEILGSYYEDMNLIYNIQSNRILNK